MTRLQRSAACLVAFVVTVAATFGVATFSPAHEALLQLTVFEAAAVATTWGLAGRRWGLVALLFALGGSLAAVGLAQFFAEEDESAGIIATIAPLPAVVLVLSPWIVAFLATPVPPPD
jgi:hypothetical protein